MRKLIQVFLTALLMCLAAGVASAQTFRVQCPLTTTFHPDATATSNGGIKCQQISGGDGFATMADGNQIYMFSFGPLSGLADIANGLPGTEPALMFDTVDPAGLVPANGYTPTPGYNGAIGLVPDQQGITTLIPEPSGANVNGVPVLVPVSNCIGTMAVANPLDPASGCLTGHVDPRLIMDTGVMNGNIPAPLIAIDEDDEFFLTLTNVGMIMRPDLFEQHTVHFHGYPNASSFYDGVPDASVAINIGGSFTYYYLAPDAGTYFWHCHITPPEHLQMGMVGQLYVRPRQNRVPVNANLYSSTPNGWQAQQLDLRKASNCAVDILCPAPGPLTTTATHANNKSGTPTFYTYNDGDGSTAYDVEYPLQIHGFDPSFHFVGMTFNPEQFADMKDKYFLLNGRSYPDTAGIAGSTPTGPMSTNSTDGAPHFSQPLNSIINIPVGGKALLRISDLDVTEYQTLASLGIPMHVVGYNARLLRDTAGNNMDYFTNSITLAGGESLDAILDASDPKYTAGQTFYLYTPNLDHLSNDAENFGGLMTEVHICSTVDPLTKACN